jgi:hypothetical protein
LKVMDDLSIDASVCMLPERAADLLAKRDLDLLVVDYEIGNGTAEVAIQSSISTHRGKMTVAALVDERPAGNEILQTGADVVIHKPLTGSFRREFRERVYSRMIK